MEYKCSTLIKNTDLVLMALIIGLSETQIPPTFPNTISEGAYSECYGCSCCVNNECDSDTICTRGCVDGYHGRKCFNACPKNCIRCTDHINPDVWVTANCTTDNCKEGFYSTEDHYQCQDSCPSECKTCVSKSDCTSCKDEFNLIIQSDRTRMCINCPANCEVCDSSEGCVVCKSGYFLEQQYCSQCMTSCKSCTSLETCTKCKTGFAGGQCDACVAGKYGTNCDGTCPRKCEKGSCDRDTGNCYSCSGNYNLPKCYFCKDGFYGSDCEYRCSVNCVEENCQKDNGHCINGCKLNFAGQTCDSCENGYYGNNCQIECPIKCFENRCERYTGNCNSCVGNFYGSKCDICKYGFYLNSFPVTETSICQACLNTCNTCSSPNSCTECIAGSYGPSCEMTCPEKCLYRRCSQTEGTCENCMEGYAGKDCLQNLTQIDGDNKSAAIGGAVGGVLGLVVIIVTMIGVLRWRRMICKGKSCFTREKNYENEPSIVNKKRAKIELQLKDLQREDDRRKQKISELKRQLQQLSGDSDNTGESGSTYETLGRDSEATGYSTLRV